MYADFFAAVRDVNSKLPADARVRVFGGDPEAAAVAVLTEQVLQKHGKALVIYGAGHFWRTLPDETLSSMDADIRLARRLERDYPGRTFTVIPVGGPVRLPPGITLNIYPDYQKFDRALKTKVRPVMVSLQRLPVRDFTAEEFIGYQVVGCPPGGRGCGSVFKGSPITLDQVADACVYVGADVDTKAKPGR